MKLLVEQVGGEIARPADGIRYRRVVEKAVESGCRQVAHPRMGEGRQQWQCSQRDRSRKRFEEVQRKKCRRDGTDGYKAANEIEKGKERMRFG